MSNKVLVANRGEIAVRVLRTCRELGLKTVAVFSEADREAPHVRYADEAYLIGPPPAQESYLRGEHIVQVALESGAQMIHPGYGFLAESPDFARTCADAGLTFVGPRPDALELLGDKTAARGVADDLDIPVIEDAAYTALRFDGEGVPPLAALDIRHTGSIDRSRVIYCGTFSQSANNMDYVHRIFLTPITCYKTPDLIMLF